MMKIIYVFMISLITLPAMADFYVNFYSSYGIFGPDGVRGLIPNEGDTALVQLLYAGDNEVIDEITDYDLSTGDDVVIGSFEYLNDGSEFAEYVEGAYGSVIAPYLGNGYIYGRVFSSLVPSLGDSYYVGSLAQVPDIAIDDIPPPLPVSYNLGGNSSNEVASLLLNFGDNVEYLVDVSNFLGGVVSPAGVINYISGSLINLTATPDLGYVFSAWVDEAGSAYPYANPASFTVVRDQTVVAVFGEDLSDEDEDGLSLYDEVITYGSDPEQGDTSGDGLLDGLLVSMGLNPTVNYSNVVATVQSSPESFGVFGADEVNELLGSITNLTDLTVAQSNELIEVQASLSAAEENLDAEIANRLLLEAEVADLTAANDALDLVNGALAEQRDGLVLQVSGLEDANQVLSASNAELELSVQSLTDEKQTLSELVASLQADNANLEAQVAGLSTNANAVLIEEIAALESTNAVLTNAIAELEVEIDMLEDEVGELEWEIADLEEALEDSYVHYDHPEWIWDHNWHYPWYKPNNYWWGWGNPPARYLPRWGREATIGKKVKMKRLKKRWKNNREEQMAEIEVDILVEAADDLTSGSWVGTTNKFMLDIPVDDADVKFYRINYN
tara:strand:- start:402 stop:2246 length:1845 start_codon:yes stop_codon:yes gene_type:complete